MKRIFNMKTLSTLMLCVVLCAVFCVFANAEYTKIVSSASGLTLENEHTILSFDNTGKVTEYTFKDDSKNYLGDDSYFAYLMKGETKLVPTSLATEARDEDTIFVNLAFADGYTLRFKTDVYDDFYTMELYGALSEEYDELVFGGPHLSSSYSDTWAASKFATFAYSLHYNTGVEAYAGGFRSNRNPVCTVYPHLDDGSDGARLALVGCPEEEFFEVLRFVSTNIADPYKVPDTTMGGAFANTEEVLDKAVRDYGIFGATGLTDEAIRFYLSYNVTQFDIHQGAATSFANGSMTFVDAVGGTPEGFRENVTDRIQKIADEEFGGIETITGLHTYHWYIDVADKNTLSNPDNLRQLDYFEDEIYTLSSDLSATARTITVFEDCSEFDMVSTWQDDNSLYLLIDDEIVKVSSHGSNTFTVTRGQACTTAAAHKKGAKVYHLKGIFSMLVPKLDSELFHQIARNTAQAYVRGGFGMIYLDAMDGTGFQTEYGGYYCSLFVTEIMAEIRRMREIDEYKDTPDPIFEYAAFPASLWSNRTRLGAQDHYIRAFKQGISSHTKSNVENKAGYSSNIGWWCLYHHESVAPFLSHPQHTDVVELLGKSIIAHNMSYSYNSFNKASVETYPIHKRNADLILKFLKLRDSHYFTDDVIEAIKGYEDEWKLIEDDEKGYGFEHRSYTELKFNDVSLDTGVVNNPFDEQVPALIRVQGLLTDSKTNYATIWDFDETKDISTYVNNTTGTKYKINAFNRSTTKAITVRVYGNGLGGRISILLASKNEHTLYQNVIPINFTGWRDMVFVETDNRVFDDDFYWGGSFPVNRNQDTTVEILGIKYSGNVTGVKLDTIKRSTEIAAEITNPAVSYNDSTITFNTTIKNGEYIEFDGTDAIKYSFDATNLGEVTYTTTGTLKAPANSKFYVTASGDAGDYVARTWVSFGFRGEQIFNDLSNEAPEKLIIMNSPDKTAYAVGETLDTTGLEVIVGMNTGRRGEVQGAVSVPDTTFTEPGMYTIPVTADGLEGSFTVSVTEKAPAHLNAFVGDAKTSYITNEAFSANGIELQLFYTNGEVETLTSGYTVTAPDMTTPGAKNVLITLDGTDTRAIYTIFVTEPELVGITMTRTPVKTTYFVGESFLDDGMIVTGTFEDGTTRTIDDYFVDYDFSISGERTATILVDGFNVSVPVTVLAEKPEASYTIAPVTSGAPAETTYKLRVNTDLADTDKVSLLEFTLSYETPLTFSGIATLNLPDGWEISTTEDAENGSVRISLADVDKKNAVTAKELIFALLFDIPCVIEGTEYPVSVVSTSAVSASGEYIAGNVGSGKVIVQNVVDVDEYHGYEIDRTNKYIYINRDALSPADVLYSFNCPVTLSKNYGTIGTGVTAKLDVGGTTVETYTIILPGDTTGNGTIEANDYTFLKRFYLGTLSGTAARREAADFNRNGFIDTNDYISIRRHVTGAINMYK